MRLKREMILVLFKTSDVGEAPTIEAAFASPEAMARYFVNHDLAKKHRLGGDGEIYPKFTSKKFKFYSLEEVKRKKKQTALERETEIAKPDEQLPPDEENTKEARLEDVLDEEDERPPIDADDK